MEYYPWWNDAQKKLAEDAKKITDEILMPLGERAAWKKEYPWEAVKVMAKQGWFGAQIPAKYGGKAEEWGVTGACIILEELSRAKTLAGNRRLVIGKQEDLIVTGDIQGLKQVLANLVDNAIKYTSDQGTITLSLFKDGKWARLEVVGTGIGIAHEHLPHLFDRFYRVDKSRSRASGGTGLGLAIIKGTAEQHGGKVSTTSELGKGSTFSVWLIL